MTAKIHIPYYTEFQTDDQIKANCAIYKTNYILLYIKLTIFCSLEFISQRRI